MRSFMRLQRQIAASFVRVPPPSYSRRFFQSPLLVRSLSFERNRFAAIIRARQTRSLNEDTRRIGERCLLTFDRARGDLTNVFTGFRLMIVRELFLLIGKFDRKFLLFMIIWYHLKLSSIMWIWSTNFLKYLKPCEMFNNFIDFINFYLSFNFCYYVKIIWNRFEIKVNDYISKNF